MGRSGGCWIGARGLQQLRCGPQGGPIDGGALLGPRSPDARASSCGGSGGVGLQGAQGGRWLLPWPLRRRRPLQRCRGQRRPLWRRLEQRDARSGGSRGTRASGGARACGSRGDVRDRRALKED